jgi:hypothetical protein
MNPQAAPERTALAYILAILGTFLIVAGLVWAMWKFAQPPPVENRGEARAKALAEIRGVESEALNTTGWVDQGKGIVRLRIDDAMNLVEREWSRNPAAARSNLLQRVEKANIVIAPPPSKPSALE